MDLKICSSWSLAALMLAMSTATHAQTTVTYIHTDALGSVVATSDEAGNVTHTRDYEPYGYELGGLSEGVGYTGHVQDSTTGLVYMQQRYYDPLIGRFISVDPMAVDLVSAWNFNRYNYAANNPYKYNDPDGRVINFVVGFAIGFAVDATVQFVRNDFDIDSVNFKQSAVSGLAGSLTGGVGGALTKAVGDGAMRASTATAGTMVTGAGAGNLATAATATVTGQELTGGQLALGVGSRTNICCIMALHCWLDAKSFSAS